MKSKPLVRRPSHNNPLNREASHLSARPSDSRPLRPLRTTTATGAAQLPFGSQAAHWEPKFPFDLVIVYENEATRARAFTLCDRLVGKLHDDHDIRQSWWKFHFLYDPQLLERAVEGALTADMIIMSLNDGKLPPLIARTWIEGWANQKDGHDSALVALVDNTPSSRCTDCPMLRYLNSVAHQAGMDFFPHVFPSAPLRADRSHVNTPALGTSVMPLIEEILRRPNNAHPWGINEY